MNTIISATDKLICLTDNTHHNHAINPPIYQSSIFHFDSLDDYIQYRNRQKEAYCYTRGNNPTTRILEEKLAKLDGGEDCRVFSSGMGAIAATLFAVLSSGDHVLVINDVYGPTREYLATLAKFGITFTIIETEQVVNLAAHVTSKTKVIYTESPGSMTFAPVDLQKVANFAKEHNIITIIDNTCMTSLLQKPLQLGFDVAVYSLTKYTGGHSDVIAGAVVTSRALLAQIDKQGYKLGGSVLSPHDAFLLLRGLRTLPTRLEATAKITQEVVSYLQNNPAIKKVFHPLAYTGEYQKIHHQQTTGITSLLSLQLVTTSTAKTKVFIDNLQTFSITVSWGGFENLVMVQEIAHFAATKSDKIIIRLALGLLDAPTIIADIEQALLKMEECNE